MRPADWTLELGYPPRALWLNRSARVGIGVSWAAVKATKALRMDAKIVGLQVVRFDPPRLREATVRATFVHSFVLRRRRVDPDGLVGTLKPVWDGLQDARLLANDDRLTHLPIRQEFVARPGQAGRLTIEVWRPDA